MAPREMPSPLAWAEMSSDPKRRDELALNPYFRECWKDFLELTSPDVPYCLKRYALLVFKPESVVGRRMTEALRYLDRHGFHPVGIARFRHSRHTVINLRSYSPERQYSSAWIQLAGAVYPSVDTMLLVLRDDITNEESNASGRLSQLKGPVGHSKPGDLRSVLRSPNRTLNFVHSADEPADMVREIGLLLDRSARRDLIHQVLASGEHGTVLDTVRDAVFALEQSSQVHDFCFAGSLARVSRVRSLACQDRQRLEEAATDGPKLNWDELTSMVDPTTIDAWDFASIACTTLDL